MRIKIIGDNNCARATRHLLRLAGFAVTEFLPADVITSAPHSGYAITIDLAPALPLTPAYEPDSSTHVPPAAVPEEASRLLRGASSPAFATDSADLPAFAQDSARSRSIAQDSARPPAFAENSDGLFGFAGGSIDLSAMAGNLSATDAMDADSPGVREGACADDEELEELLATASGIQAERNSHGVNIGGNAGETKPAAASAGMGHGSAEIARGGKVSPNARSGIAAGNGGGQAVENAREANAGGNSSGAQNVTPNAGLAQDGAANACAASCGGNADGAKGATANARFENISANIRFDSVESELETAVLRHVTRMAKAPVIVDRPGGVVHSERELRITLPRTGDAKADESAAVAVEFGVLRGLLDLSRRPSGSEVCGGVRAEKFALRGKDAAEAARAAEADRMRPGNDEKVGAKNSSRKWWMFGVALVGVTCVCLMLPGALAARTKANLSGSCFRLRGEELRKAKRPQAEACATQARVVRGVASVVAARVVVAPGAARPGAAVHILVAPRVTSEQRVLPELRVIPELRVMPRLRVAAGLAAPVSASAVAATPAIPEPQGQFATGQGVKIFDGANTFTVDPCQAQAKSYLSINQTANTQLLAGTASKKIYICSMHVVVAAAANVALVEGTGTVCATSTAGVSGFGGATAATGWNFSANSGIVVGNGASSVGAEGTAADNLCLFTSGAGQISGGISYVVQ